MHNGVVDVRRVSRLTALALVCALAACTHVFTETGETTAHTLCETRGVAISADFSSAGQHGCAIRPDGFVLSVSPEPAIDGVINPSPWYAFKVSGQSDGPVRVKIDYSKFRHRYTPRMSYDGETWFDLDEGSAVVSDDERILSLDLPPVSGSYLVAGQPLMDINKVDSLTDALIQKFALKEEVVGYSHQGRPILALTAGNPDADKLVIALTRQHPPEITGTRAFFAFADTLLRAVTTEELQTTRILLFPLANPDGVENGHWRHNMGGVDTNRDWYTVSQPEIAAIQAKIRAEAEGKTVAAFLDFHSTWRTLVYTPPLDKPDTDMTFPNALKTAFDATFTPQPDWIVGHNADNGTSKNWALVTFNTPGLTIELGDEVSANETTQIGAVTAEILASTLRSR